ncbi:hypothetical protein RNQ17_23785, partial [Escherichia coli]
ADRNRSHWSTSKTPSYTKSVSWQHHPITEIKIFPMFTVIKITAGPYYLKSGVCYANVVKFAG